MSIAHVQGASAYGPSGSGGSVSLSGVTAGNCLVLSIGVHHYISDAKGFPQVSDNQGNQWFLATTSPATATTQDWIIYTFVALNVIGGTVAVTYAANNGGTTEPGLVLDEYSGVAHAIGYFPATFNSTLYGSGLLFINSLNIPAQTGQLLYSAGFAAASGAGLTFGLSASGGFTSRSSIANTFVSVSSFDQLVPSNASYSNTITVSGGTPDTVHVVVLILFPTNPSVPLVQQNFYLNTSIVTNSTTAVYALPNTAGNLLIAICVYTGRNGPSITDTSGNTWVIVPGASPESNFLMAYCTGCKAASAGNQVTLNTSGGGDDDFLCMMLAEYAAQGAGFISSSFGVNTGTTVNTGNVSSTGMALLVSGFLGGTPSGSNLNAYQPVSNLGVNRFQVADSGFVNEFPTSIVLADQVETMSGTYNNLFTANQSAQQQAIILGFTLPPVSLICASGFGQIGVAYLSGVTASGGTPPYTYAIIAGGMPPGLSFNNTTGVISGIPVTVGSYPYTAQVTDSLSEVATVSCIITIGTKGSCGALPTLELTRDLDANWGDSSTFFITQSEPLPFTLRGIVLRLSYNQD